MKRLTKQQKEMIKKLVDEKHSIRKIADKLQLPKSDIYYWYRKFFGKKLKEIKINNKLKEDIGELTGAFAGDGNFYLNKNYGYRIRFYLSGDEIEYARRINKKLKKVYGKHGRIYKYKNIIIVDIYGKKIISHIKSFLLWDKNKTTTVGLIGKVSSYSPEFLKGFCRGLFDTDGWVTKNNLMINCSSDKLMKNLSQALHLLKIPHLLTVWKRKDEKSHFAIFLKKENTLKYFKTIGSSNPKRIKSVLPLGISGKAF